MDTRMGSGVGARGVGEAAAAAAAPPNALPALPLLLGCGRAVGLEAADGLGRGGGVEKQRV